MIFTKVPIGLESEYSENKYILPERRGNKFKLNLLKYSLSKTESPSFSTAMALWESVFSTPPL